MRSLLLTGTMIVILSAVLGALCDLDRVVQPCDAAQRSTIVFYGEVIAAERRPFTRPTDMLFGGWQDVRFRVLTPIKGVKTDTFDGAFDAAEDDFRSFQAGMRVIVYATASNARWSTTCSRTKAMAVPDDPQVLSELSALSRCDPQTPR